MATILSTWIVQTLAGSGEPGFVGDGAPAARACLNEPKGIAIDGHGHVYVADSENHVIRKIDRATGLISTIAGLPGDELPRVAPQESNVDPTDEDPLAEDSGGASSQRYAQQTDLSGTVRYCINGSAKSTRYSGDGGPAVNAQLNFPTAVAVDRQGNVYIADTMNHRVRMVDVTTGVISTLTGTGQARFSGDEGPAEQASLNEPAALAIGDDGLLYIADQSNHRVRVVDVKTRVIRTLAGTGAAAYDGDGKPAIETALAGPSGLALSADRLYIADTFNGRVRCVQLSSGLMTTVAGDGGTYRWESPMDPPSTSLSRPTGIALDHEGNLFLTDSDNHLVRRWDSEEGLAFNMAGTGAAAFSGDDGLARDASLCYPFGIVADQDGALLVADTFNHRIRKLTLE